MNSQSCNFHRRSNILSLGKNMIWQWKLGHSLHTLLNLEFLWTWWLSDIGKGRERKEYRCKVRCGWKLFKTLLCPDSACENNYERKPCPTGCALLAWMRVHVFKASHLRRRNPEYYEHLGSNCLHMQSEPFKVILPLKEQIHRVTFSYY